MNQDITDILNDIRMRYGMGHEASARERLLFVWQGFCDSLAAPGVAEGALCLMGEFGFSTDDPEEWDALPDPVVLYRVGSADGVSWSTDRAFVKREAEGGRVFKLRAAKAEALAYITGRGESEVILRPEFVRGLNADSRRSSDPQT